MAPTSAPDLIGGQGQGVVQVVELLIAFVLSALIGLEREVRGKSAGLRGPGQVGVMMILTGTGVGDAVRLLGSVDGVSGVEVVDEESE